MRWREKPPTSGPLSPCSARSQTGPGLRERRARGFRTTRRRIALIRQKVAVLCGVLEGVTKELCRCKVVRRYLNLEPLLDNLVLTRPECVPIPRQLQCFVGCEREMYDQVVSNRADGLRTDVRIRFV